MKIIASLLCLCMITISTPMAPAQTTATAPPPQVIKNAVAFGLPDGTPVRLRTTQNLSSADAITGSTIDFEVLEDVKSGDTVIIPRGGIALGTVTRGKPKGRMGKGGKLDISIDSVRLVSGEKAALRASRETKGNSSTGVMTGAIVASSILFFPAAPFFLFMKGKDIKIPKSTEITAYINGDVSLDPAKFTGALPGLGTNVANTPSPEFSDVSIKSVPEGAEITIDGKFVGSTPSSLRLNPGEHTIVVKKTDYMTWERTIKLNAGGNITLDATLLKP